jgi:hypothetical protein
MSYAALGATYSVSTPWGSQSISIPVEQMAHDAATIALEAAWPPLRQRLVQELPGIMDMAVEEVQPDLRAEIDRAIQIGTKRLMLGVAVLGSVIAVSTFLLVRKR